MWQAGRPEGERAGCYGTYISQTISLTVLLFVRVGPANDVGRNAISTRQFNKSPYSFLITEQSPVTRGNPGNVLWIALLRLIRKKLFDFDNRIG